MRRELDSTISVTSFLILAGLVALVFSGCGRNAYEPDVNRDNDSKRACGYQFELEQEQSTLKGQLAILAGVWRDNYTDGYTVVRIGGKDLQQKNGIEFDFVKGIYGENRIRFSSVTPNLVLDSFDGPTIKHNALRISTPLAGVGDGTYRAIEMFLSDRAPSYNNCRTYLYKITDGDNIVVTPGKTHFLVGSGVTAPPIQEYIQDLSNLESYKYVRQQ